MISRSVSSVVSAVSSVSVTVTSEEAIISIPALEFFAACCMPTTAAVPASMTETPPIIIFFSIKPVPSLAALDAAAVIFFADPLVRFAFDAEGPVSVCESEAGIGLKLTCSASFIKSFVRNGSPIPKSFVLF